MIWVVITMSLIAFFQVPVLLRQKQRRELLSFSALWLIAAAYSLMAALDVPLPRLLEVIDFVYGRIFQFIKLISP
ncbi:MAG: hypothetical protein ACOX1J_05415 [Dethiobacteria bacterium]|jgi:hypothetical protein